MAHSTVSPAPALPPESPHAYSRGKHLIAVLLSAFLPGSGHLIIGQRRKGCVLTSLFLALLLCLWPLRLPRFYPGLIFVLLVWLALSLYASYSALFAKPSPAARSKAWLLVVPPFVYVGINLVFTPLLLLSGFRAFRFNSSAIEPTLFIGDQFIIDQNYYRHKSLVHDDLVVVRRKDYQTVKRVIAIGGDKIQARNREILINGRVVDEPFIQHTRPPGIDPEMDSFRPITVPGGRVFLMGDNRDVSLDSRAKDFGLLTTDAIIGKPLYIYRSPLKRRLGKQLQ